MQGDRHLHLIRPGHGVDRSTIDADDVGAAPGDKDETKAALVPLVERLGDYQGRLWAEADRRVLVVLQGIDTSGKGGTVEHVLGAVHPAGLRVVSFKAPSTTELTHDYLWRVHAKVPAAGELGVFDRSHYEDVLAARVECDVPEERWRRRYDHINAFEQMLTDEGTTLVKVFLHLSTDEQRARLQARLDDPTKRWKFRKDDLTSRARWDDYRPAFQEMIDRTSTEHAPWYVVPADRKWYRNWAVATILVGVLEHLDPRYPEPLDDPSGVVIR